MHMLVPLPAAASPTAESPRYIPESDPDEDLEEDDDEDPKADPVDYPADHDDKEDEDTQDIYGVMKDTQGRHTEILQRVKALVNDRQIDSDPDHTAFFTTWTSSDGSRRDPSTSG
nr:hypothetical protein [Tanacetum cinerariifolium]